MLGASQEMVTSMAWALPVWKKRIVEKTLSRRGR